MSAVRSVREAFDTWHPPEFTIIEYNFYKGHVRRFVVARKHWEIAPPLVDCQRCLNMEIGEMVFILEAHGPMAGTIRFQAAKAKLTPEQELRRMEEATAGAPTDSEGWEG